MEYWTVGNKSGLITLSENPATLDELFAQHINELRRSSPSWINAGYFGTGNTDVEIQAALNLAHTAGGRTVYVPFGTWLLSNSLVIYDDTPLVGDGFATILKQANGANLGWLIRSSNAGYEDHYRMTISRLQIDGNYLNQNYSGFDPAAFKGAGILADGWNDTNFELLLIKNCGRYGGICTYGRDVNIDRCIILDTVADSGYGSGIFISATSVHNVNISKCVISGCGDKAIFLEDRVDTIHISDCHLLDNGEGIIGDDTAITEIGIENCRVSGCTVANGIRLGALTKNFNIANCRVYNNYCHGIYIVGSTNGIISNCNSYNNSQGSSNSYDGICIGGDAPRSIVLVGNNCFDDQALPTQRTGIFLGAGTDYVLVTGNCCRGNATSNIENLGGVNNKVDAGTNIF
jgi:parallel beta-helix repeat protein